MTLTLHQHPFASYCWKALIAAYELEIEFTPRQVETAEDWAQLAELWPMRKIPLLEDDKAKLLLPESSTIIEYLDGLSNAHQLIPRDPARALQARLWDRFFDGFVMNPMQKIVLDHLRPADQRDRFGVDEARATLRAAYALLEDRIAADWVAGDQFTIGDCAAAPALHYALAVERWDEAAQPKLARYYAQLSARPSVSRVIDEARAYRSYFPPGWPEYMN